MPPAKPIDVRPASSATATARQIIDLSAILSNTIGSKHKATTEVSFAGGRIGSVLQPMLISACVAVEGKSMSGMLPGG